MGFELTRHLIWEKLIWFELNRVTWFESSRHLPSPPGIPDSAPLLTSLALDSIFHRDKIQITGSLQLDFYPLRLHLGYFSISKWWPNIQLMHLGNTFVSIGSGQIATNIILAQYKGPWVHCCAFTDYLPRTRLLHIFRYVHSAAIYLQCEYIHNFTSMASGIS